MLISPNSLPELREAGHAQISWQQIGLNLVTGIHTFPPSLIFVSQTNSYTHPQEGKNLHINMRPNANFLPECSSGTQVKAFHMTECYYHPIDVSVGLV